MYHIPPFQRKPPPPTTTPLGGSGKRSIQIGSAKGETPLKMRYFDKSEAPSAVESATPEREANALPMKGALKITAPPVTARRSVNLGTTKGETPLKMRYFDKSEAPSAVESATPEREANALPMKGSLKYTAPLSPLPSDDYPEISSSPYRNDNDSSDSEQDQEDMMAGFAYTCFGESGEIVPGKRDWRQRSPPKFKPESATSSSSSSSSRAVLGNILKFMLLFKHKGLLANPLYYLLKESLLSGKNTDIIDIFNKYDLTALSDSQNLSHLQHLFDTIYQYAVSLATTQLNSLFTEANLMAGHHISNDYQSSSNIDGNGIGSNHSRNLIYGEVEFDSFQKVMETACTGLKINNKKGNGNGNGNGISKFTDLGSGTGKACLWAASTTNFNKIIGIEILDGLYNKSLEVLDEYYSLNNMSVSAVSMSIKQTDSNSNANANANAGDYVNDCTSTIEFIKDDFLSDSNANNDDNDWTDSDLVFANSTCFPEDLMMKLAVRSQLMKPFSRFITFTSSLDSPYWKVIYKERYKMSWGYATVFIHERLAAEDVIENMRNGGGERCGENEDENESASASYINKQERGHSRSDDDVWNDWNDFGYD
jgi:hypothetical protein